MPDYNTEALYNYYQGLPPKLQNLFKQKYGKDNVQEWFPALEKISKKIDKAENIKDTKPKKLEKIVYSALGMSQPKSMLRKAFPYAAAASFAGVALLYIL